MSNKKIETLTHEQDAMRQVYHDNGIKIGNRTGPIDRQAATQAVLSLYRNHLKLPEPEFGIIFVTSPRAALHLLRDKFGVSFQESWGARYFANFDIGFLNFCKFFTEVCPIPEVKDISQHFVALGETCATMFVFEQVCVLTDYPKVIRTNAQGHSHCLDGPAVEYETDPTTGITQKCYAWNRLTVPESLVLNRETALTPERIDKETNAELRRVMLEVFGFERYLLAGGAKLLNKSKWGELYQKRVADDEPLTMVLVDNKTAEPDGTFKKYALMVHPELRPRVGGTPSNPVYGEPQKMTALNAIASTFRMTGRQYAKMLDAET